MEAEQRRKRKRVLGRHLHISSRSFFLCFSFFIFLFFLSSHHRFTIFFTPSTLRLPLKASSLSLYSTASHSILDPLHHTTTTTSFTLQHRILFPDHLLLLILTNQQKTQPHELECVYYTLLTNGSASGSPEPVLDVRVQPVLSTDRYDESRSIARCPFPGANYSGAGAAKAVDLRRRGEVGRRGLGFSMNQTVESWDRVAYEATLDGDTVVVFVKGLNLRPHKISDPSRFRCHFGLKSFNNESAFLLTTRVVSVAQEVVRCGLPQSIRNNPYKARGIRVTVSYLGGNVRHPVRALVPSVARVGIPGGGGGPRDQRRNRVKHELCVCTMVWNQASALREWIMYHAWLGVERWFIYDNNSDDDIEKVIQDLDLEGYNVSRQAWPWIKTQEAGFSHCALRAREECKWVGFFDVDEFFYFPNEFHHMLGQSVPGENSLRSMVANFSSSASIAEIRTACHSFGPSGLNSHPKKGVTIGYTCRLQSPERHKSIVRPDLLDISLLNVVHHFQLREGFKYHNMPEGSAIINHYKYQVWETFKAKFFRRVATYVVDWQEDQNKGSKDRAPGLGTEAVQPPNWRLQFCEVWDTGLKNFLLSYFADPATGLMPWERSFL
ncbi:glycosyltransferase family 92 protein RCOM_0530710 [Gastrolobium bilobum]|uniref:glycosyltransferase family 92 protein RCOM_0530710 n=1 Tax=Gastrolobium bilobum TaxID=150636 RepID=UPI002AB0DD56|nr:glycosyltransferase family 92 protein RCOM_0530710 [Gastrolobium bilobum]